MIYEFCAENVTLLDKALEAGAKRVELCDNLTVGGTTPSYGVIEAAVRMVEPYDATVMTMIRPRGGNFVYSDMEIEIMLSDIQKAREAGSHGLVFGVLTENNEIDYPKMERLLEAAQGLDVVFHMAFDAILEHLAWLDELIEHAVGRIEILPGGGINLENRAEIANTLGVDQLHGTKVVF